MGDVAELLLFLPRLHIRLRLRSSSATIYPFTKEDREKVIL